MQTSQSVLACSNYLIYHREIADRSIEPFLKRRTVLLSPGTQIPVSDICKYFYCSGEEIILVRSIKTANGDHFLLEGEDDTYWRPGLSFFPDKKVSIFNRSHCAKGDVGRYVPMTGGRERGTKAKQARRWDDDKAE